MNLYRDLLVKAAAAEENWRQVKRWAWRHLNSAHPGERLDRGDPARLKSALVAQTAPPAAKPRARTLSEHRRDEMKAQSITLSAARTAWEDHIRIRAAPAIDADERGTLFKTSIHCPSPRCHTITPNIIVHDADQAADFLKRAFGMQETHRVTTPEGKVAHCELQLEDSILHLAESIDAWPAHGLVAKIYVTDPDALLDQAVMAGASVVAPMADTVFGSREGCIVDPFGNVWLIATRTEEISGQEMQRRMATQES